VGVLALWVMNRDGDTGPTAGRRPSDGDRGENQLFNSAGSRRGEAVRVVSREIAMRRTAANLAGGYAGIIPGDLMVLGR